MASLTVAFTGTTSVLTSNFFPAITLDPDSNYYCALLDFTSYNSIPNIIEGKNNKFHFSYTDSNGGIKEETITLTTGAYEVAEILTYIKSKLAELSITLTYDIIIATSQVKLRFDKTINCTNDSILRVIGFNENDSLNFEADKDYLSDDIIRISDIDIIRIECDIVEGSYINGKLCHTIHQFSNCKVSPGYKFIEVPQHIIYLPIRERNLRNIQISVVDQNGDPIDFRGEQISCRIHIRKV